MGPTCLVDVRVQTEDGTALAGREYTAFDSIIQLNTNQETPLVNLNINFPDNQVSASQQKLKTVKIAFFKIGGCLDWKKKSQYNANHLTPIVVNVNKLWQIISFASWKETLENLSVVSMWNRVKEAKKESVIFKFICIY